MIRDIKFVSFLLILTNTTFLFGCNKSIMFEISELQVKENNKNIYGLITKPKNGKDRNPLLICSHGFNGNEQIFEDLTNEIVQKGFNIYRYHFCGGATTSKSSGDTKEMSIMTEKDDLNLVIDNAKTWDFVDSSKIYLLGESQGGIVTSIVSNHRNDIAGTILWYPAFNIPATARNYSTLESIPETINVYGFTIGKKYYQDIYNYYPYEDMGNINHKVLIVHGTKDLVVPLSVSEEAKKYYKNCEILTVDNANHCFYDKIFKYNKTFMGEAVKKTLTYFD